MTVIAQKWENPTIKQWKFDYPNMRSAQIRYLSDNADVGIIGVRYLTCVKIVGEVRL